MLEENILFSEVLKGDLKVQYKKQAGRNNLAVIYFKEHVAGSKWVQKLQLVVKNMPGFFAMLIMKRLQAEIANGCITFEDCKSKRDEIVKEYDQGTFLFLVKRWMEPETDESGLCEITIDMDIFEFLTSRLHKLPVAQQVPAEKPSLKRAQPLRSTSGLSEGSDDHSVGPPLPVPPGGPLTVNTCETQV